MLKGPLGKLSEEAHICILYTYLMDPEEVQLKFIVTMSILHNYIFSRRAGRQGRAGGGQGGLAPAGVHLD